MILSRRTTWERAGRPAPRPGEIDLTRSDPTRAGLAYPDDDLRQAMIRGAAAPYEPHPRGLSSARRAIGEAIGVDPDRVALTASTSEAYSHAFRVLADPGDRVLVSRPGYPLFRLLGELDGLEVGTYPRLEELDGGPDLGELGASLDERTRAVVAVSPDNPTGALLGDRDLRALGEVAAGAGAALILDEVFRDHVWDGAPPVPPPGSCLTLRFGGLSKTAGLPGAKLAWTVVEGPDDDVRAFLDRLDVVLDTYLSPSMAVQVATPDLLALAPRIRAAIRERVLGNRDRALGSRERWVRAAPVPAGWSAVLRVPAVRSDEEWARLLLEREAVRVHPGSLFGFDRPGRLVVSLLPEPEVFGEGMDRIERAVGAAS